jgi:hypothetical protein
MFGGMRNCRARFQMAAHFFFVFQLHEKRLCQPNTSIRVYCFFLILSSSYYVLINSHRLHRGIEYGAQNVKFMCSSEQGGIYCSRGTEAIKMCRTL